MALSKEDNELLTRVGPGAPMGELFRRFWTPVLLANELPEPDSPPIRVKLFTEFFVAFRDTQGRLGLLDARCPHRGADLSFGLVEEGGIRCGRCYWKFDVEGNILDMPLEPADSPLWTEVKAPAFRIAEFGGLLWAYVGPQDDVPDLPEFEWTRVEPDHRYLSRFLVECNYMQAVEGGLDAARVAALKKAGALGPDDPMGEETAHSVQARETEYGLLVGTAVESDVQEAEMSVAQWLMPFYTTQASGRQSIYEGTAWAPIDDESTMAFAVTYNPRRPLSRRILTEIRQGKRIHPKLQEGMYRRERNRENGYVPEGKERPTDFASRFETSFEMALACQESMGAIVDRSQEMLGPNDGAVEGARRILMQAAVDLMEGTIPVVVHRGEAYRVRAYAAQVAEPDAFDEDERVRKGIVPEV
ncbi:MAG: Rieske 2Fe-2S domain-containing protein [Chloroflexota bacterium]|nr:Rieske 2Fe-2S domain-containing protein [Chloroflexota bacterium]MDE2886013.1 Rieske 2Fe-2S domain-containing protein [Chloroflexota bacterium]